MLWPQGVEIIWSKGYNPDNMWPICGPSWPNPELGLPHLLSTSWIGWKDEMRNMGLFKSYIWSFHSTKYSNIAHQNIENIPTFCSRNIFHLRIKENFIHCFLSILLLYVFHILSRHVICFEDRFSVSQLRYLFGQWFISSSTILDSISGTSVWTYMKGFFLTWSPKYLYDFTDLC